MNRLLCRLLGHRWRWVGWAFDGPVGAPEDELFACERCGATKTETFGG